MKKFFISGAVSLSIVIAIAIYLNVFHWNFCPNQYHNYKTWFPYHINDTIVLKSGNEFKILTVKNIHFKYNKFNDESKECRACANNYTLELNDNQDVISIFLENLENINSCLSANYSTNLNQDSTEKEIQIHDKHFHLENITIQKNTGIHKIKIDDKVWEFVQLKKGDKEEHNVSYQYTIN